VPPRGGLAKIGTAIVPNFKCVDRHASCHTTSGRNTDGAVAIGVSE